MEDDVKIFEAADLANTYIRAKGPDGKWGSFSFAELLSDPKQHEEILAWFGQKMLGAAGVEPDGNLSESAVVNICRIVEVVHGPLAKLKLEDNVE